MADSQTPDEVKAERIEKLGATLGPVFHALSDDIAWLHVKWAEFRELFGGSQERIDLLNSSAGLFFYILHDTLWDDALLHIARLTDPVEMRGKRNLTIKALPELCGEPKLRARVIDLVEHAISASAFARDWRNRRIGHRDLPLALKDHTQPLAPASRADVSTALKAIHDVLREIAKTLMKTELDPRVITNSTGAVALLYVLRDGIEADQARRARIESGGFTEKDIRPPI